MRALDVDPRLDAHELRDGLRARAAHPRRAQVVRGRRGGDVHREDERADAVERAAPRGGVQRRAVAGAEVEEGEGGEEVELCGGGGEGEREGVAVGGAEAGEGVCEGGGAEEAFDGCVADLWARMSHRWVQCGGH